MKNLITTALILSGYILSAQENLVPNPSFEQNTGCPDQPSHIWLSEGWERVGGSGVISYYHECGDVCCGIPVNRVGYQSARSGSAYADLSLLHNNHLLSFHVEGNFIGIGLIDPLDNGKRYLFECYISLYDSARFAGRNIGVHFSQGQPLDTDEYLLSLEPQVRYEGDFLTDKEGWMEISGNFIAEGGEDYMTIGNFDGYFNSDTLNLHEGGMYPTIGYWEVAYYFLDDVSVVEDTSYHVGFESLSHPHKGPELKVWPNPSTGDLNIRLAEQLNGSRLVVHGMDGRKVKDIANVRSGVLTLQNLTVGVYSVRVFLPGGKPITERFVILK